MFIQILLEEKKKGHWKMNMDSYNSMQHAVDFINMMMEEEYAWDDVLTLRNILKKRYQTFKIVLEIDGVWWDRRVNHVYAPNWGDIFKALIFLKISVRYLHCYT